MSALRTFLSRLRGLIGGSRPDRELQTEIASHIAEAVEDSVRQGMTPKEARRAALARFGGVRQTIAAHRDQRRVVWVEHAVQDVRYGVRQVRKHPGFAALVVLILGLGMDS